MRYTNLGLVSITMKGATMYMLLVMLCCTTAVAQTPIEVELQRLEDGVRSARSAAEQESYAPQLSDLGVQAVEADEYDVAVKAYDYAQRITRSTRPADAAEYAQRMLDAKTAGREYAKVKRYVGQDDAASKRKVAEFGAFVKREWETALPVLAEGDDAIAQAAQLDMRHLGGEEAEAVGDAWVEAARRDTAHASVLYARAGSLYDEAAAVVPTLALLNKMSKLGSKIGYEKGWPVGAVPVRGGKRAFVGGRLFDSRQTADLAFDGKFTTLAHIEKGPGAWLGVDFGRPVQITKFVIAPHECDPGWQEYNRTRHVGAVLQVCNRPDFIGAVTVHTIEEPLEHGRLTIITVTVKGVWRYARCMSRPGDQCAIGEFDVY